MSGGKPFCCTRHKMRDPESVDPLNAKLRLGCAEVVKVRDLLWKGLEIEVEIQNVNREGRKAKRKALLFVAPF